MNDLVVTETKLPQRQSFYDLGPEEMINAATRVAGTLAKVIEAQKLYTDIQGKKHVRVEGWIALGSIMGILPKEESVEEMADGSFMARVNLVRFSDGLPIGGASALCSIDEKRWANADKFARRSMAITRATGKAYRLTLGWIMPLAGYEGTPAEEFDVTPDRPPAQAQYQPPPKSNEPLIPISAELVKYNFNSKKTLKEEFKGEWNAAAKNWFIPKSLHAAAEKFLRSVASPLQTEALPMDGDIPF